MTLVLGGLFVGALAIVFAPGAMNELPRTPANAREVVSGASAIDRAAHRAESELGHGSSIGSSPLPGERVAGDSALIAAAGRGDRTEADVGVDFIAPVAPFVPGRAPGSFLPRDTGASGAIDPATGAPLGHGAPPAEGESASTPGRIDGVISDAATESLLGGVRIRASAFRAIARPEGELLEIAGTPPLAIHETETDDLGRFSLPLVDPEDATLLL
ncbi:MAG TPA: hypothetical protein VK116_16050, partial [Planctomycetota bacterium]|nr:hypothetical protein [Planctomycetota bacterium]